VKHVAPARAAYVHVPFCRHRCGYCNFTVVAGRDDLIDRYLEALAIELSWLQTPQPVDTLFIGGGTPTHLAPSQLTKLLQLVRHWFPLQPGGEWSVEVNPSDLSAEKAERLVRAGVNRISLGVQSFRDEKLRILERDHRGPQIRAALQQARQHFATISIDLIFAAPGESLDQWRQDLAMAMASGVHHLSVYGLTYEKGTTFWGRRLRTELVPVKEQVERDMYLLAIDTLTGHGWRHYEISNFARPGFRCRHNEVYWKGEPYYAAGPGAARYLNGRRETNHRSTFSYMKRVLAGQSPTAESDDLTAEERAREQFVLRMRMLEGVSRAEFLAATGFDVDQLVGPQLQRFAEAGLIVHQGDQVRLTRAGLLVSDSLWPALI
jgi:oxygen-independent coproporphyrinogen-3 oxidase